MSSRASSCAIRPSAHDRLPESLKGRWKSFPALLACALLLFGCTPSAVPAGVVANATPSLQATAATSSTSDDATAVVAVTASQCVARDDRPDPTCTPGVADPRVTQANIHETICRSGYSSSVRPSTSVTRPIKAERMKAYGYSDSPANYELDHLISLELGGHPSDVRNLWPEAYGRSQWDAARKDQVENKLHALVCAGTVSLADAQHLEATDWKAAWARYVGR